MQRLFQELRRSCCRGTTWSVASAEYRQHVRAHTRPYARVCTHKYVCACVSVDILREGAAEFRIGIGGAWVTVTRRGASGPHGADIRETSIVLAHHFRACRFCIGAGWTVCTLGEGTQQRGSASGQRRRGFGATRRCAASIQRDCGPQLKHLVIDKVYFPKNREDAGVASVQLDRRQSPPLADCKIQRQRSYVSML